MIPIIYDQINGWTKFDEFIISLLTKQKLTHIADLGCGTGRVTSRLSGNGYHITAIDPNEEAIAYAKQKYEANDNVNWIVGDSSNLQANTYDAIIMTANVAQVFVTDESWQKVIEDVYQSLIPGGNFIFDARNPLTKVWEKWEADLTPDYAEDSHTGERLEIWTEYDGFIDDVYTFTDIVKKANSDEIIVKQKSELKFRTLETLLHSLFEGRFNSIQVYEDGQFKQATSDAHYFVFHCVK